jgi:hypothetical protein
MTPQQRHEAIIERMKLTTDPAEWAWLNRLNDIAVAAYYGLTVEQLETNIQVCWR